jgi:hypothetical protein
VPFLLASYYGIESFKPQASNIQNISATRLDPERSEDIELPDGSPSKEGDHVIPPFLMIFYSLFNAE